MTYTQSELRGFAEKYQFMPHTLFLEKNHRCLEIALRNIDANMPEISRSTIGLKDGSIAFRSGLPTIRSKRSVASPEEVENMQLRLISALHSDTPAAPAAISESERRKLQAIACATL